MKRFGAAPCQRSVYVSPGQPANTARFAFLDPRAKDFYAGVPRVSI